MAETTFSRYKSETFSMNHTHYPTAPVVSMHVHDIEELLFLRTENSYYHEDGKTYPLNKNCLVISRSGKNHGVSFDGNCEYERYATLFNAENLTSSIYNQIPSDISVIHFSDNSHIHDLFQKMDYYCKHFQGVELENILLHLIEEILYNVVITLKQTSPSSTYSENPLISKAISFIDQNINKPITLDMLCNELFITKVYLHQIFLKHMQITPKKYIMTQKLLRAQKELRSGQKTTEVYLNYGFSDYSSFYRNYKSYFGHAPSEATKAKVIHEIQS